MELLHGYGTKASTAAPFFPLEATTSINNVMELFEKVSILCNFRSLS
jgi:hypothetical protein